MPIIMLESPEAQNLMERDYRLRHLMQAVGDLECRKPELAFHSLAHSIIEQMLSMKVGRAIEERLLDLCEDELIPDRVARLAPESIKACGMSMRKAQYLHSLAEYALTYDLESCQMQQWAGSCRSCQVSVNGSATCFCSSTWEGQTYCQLKMVIIGCKPGGTVSLLRFIQNTLSNSIKTKEHAGGWIKKYCNGASIPRGREELPAHGARTDRRWCPGSRLSRSPWRVVCPQRRIYRHSA